MSLSPQFITSTIMLSIAYVIYVVLTTIDKDYKSIETAFTKVFLYVKITMYALLYVAVSAVFFMLNVGSDKKVAGIAWMATVFVIAYVAMTSYINIHTLRKIKKLKSEWEKAEKEWNVTNPQTGNVIQNSTDMLQSLVKMFSS